VKWLKDHAVDLQVDTHKVAIMGTSAGGQLAPLVGATAEDPDFEDPADGSQASTKVQAIVDIDGVLAFIHPDSQEGAVAGKWLGGDQNEARKKWIEASPITH
ncbi:MAG TPA: esterase, partial [Balneolaceae bacterium]|nr:esterase [Balneolaceae bacterium]